MIKKLITIGLIGGFISSGFTVPTGANVQASMGLAQNELGTRVLSAVTSDNARETATILAEKLKPVQTTKRVVTMAVQRYRFSAAWKKLLASTGDEFLRTQLERVEWASRKSDIRLCGEAEGAEYLVLCVAVLTGDPARCGQIENNELRTLCSDELAYP